MSPNRRIEPPDSCTLIFMVGLLLATFSGTTRGVEDGAPRAGKPAGTSLPAITPPVAGEPGSRTGSGTAGKPREATGSVTAGDSSTTDEPTTTPDDADAPPEGTADTATQPEQKASTDADKPPAPPRNPPLRMETRRNRDLAKELERQGGRIGQPVWVGEGNEPFLAVLSPQQGLDVKGGVILLHDQAQHPDWPGILHALRTRLPSNGWMTLSVAVPDFVPADTKSPKSSETPPLTERRVVIPEGDNGEFLQRQAEFPADDYQREVKARIDKAIDKLLAVEDMPIALAAFGQTAGLVSGLLAMNPDERLDALIMVDPEEFPAPRFRVAEDLARLEIPVLDITNDQPDEGSAEWRRQEAKRSPRSRYEQRRIMSADREFEGFEVMVSKSVSGWLSRRIDGRSRPPETGDDEEASSSSVAASASPGVTGTATAATQGAAAGTTGAQPTSARNAGASAAATNAAATRLPAPPPPVPGRPRLVTPNLQEPVPIPPPVPP
jgi:hypothetical protein